MIRIYISSSFIDLNECRQKVAAILRQNQKYQVIGMEDYQAKDDRPLDYCLKDVRSCQIYVGIFAFRYGHIPPEQPNGAECSITELEYQCATENGLKRLIFFLKEGAHWPTDHVDKDRHRIDDLRERLGSQHLRKEFTNGDDLAAQVYSAVSTAVDELKPGQPQPNEPPSEPGIGPYFYLECNRDDEISDFHSFRNNHPDARIFTCTIPGHEGDLPASLTRRLMETEVRSHAETLFDKEQGAIKSLDIKWPGLGQLTQRKERLLANVSLEARFQDRQGVRQEPAAYAGYLSARLEKVHVLNHRIVLNDWKEDDGRLLQAYGDFWEKVAEKLEEARLFLFFNLILPEPSKFQLFFRRTAPWEDALNRIRAIFNHNSRGGAARMASFNCDILRCVTYECVEFWIKKYDAARPLQARRGGSRAGLGGNLEGEKRIEDIKNDLLDRKSCRPMREIESQLKELSELL